ncbi:cation:proton antiporter regulatory subunit [Haloglomus litoreum]|uniref:cation:proton antiporter regulatory subunit n=1 Tax=Haloglomus litoreum TaxID=3034026 RepID=UPI0023E8B7AE|nr:TrkA C-terminal domain-containing protein [Haloglomus sp. DT116]
MRVFDTQLPGVGERFTVRFGHGGELVVLVRNQGGREVFWRGDADGDSEELFELTERQARKLAEIFDGTYFQPVDEDVESVLEDAVVEWVEVDADAPLAGRTLGEADVRRRTGVTVLAVQRGQRTHANPDASFGVRAGDVLVAVGEPDAHDDLEAYLAGGD